MVRAQQARTRRREAGKPVTPVHEPDYYDALAKSKTPAQLRAEYARMVEALEWIAAQKHTPRPYRHMQFEKLLDAAKYGLGADISMP